MLTVPALSHDLATFDRVMAKDGWIIFDRLIDGDLLARLTAETESAYTVCRDTQVANGIGDITEGTLHHLIGQGDSFLEFIDRQEPLVPYFESYFKGRFVLNSFGGNILKKSASYASAVHRDIRTFSGDMPLLLNTLLMLDDFTVENGATLMMTGSHLTHPDKPTDEEFHAKAQHAVGKAGSLLVFDSNLWHAAGINQTDVARRSITPMYCRPFIKPQFDYPRALGYDKLETYSDHRCQVLGYYARIPASLDEWYQPPAKRMYRGNQG
jgi:hypothetical protein